MYTMQRRAEAKGRRLLRVLLLCGHSLPANTVGKRITVKEKAMPESVSRNEVQRLFREEDALLIEVLPSQEYEEEHIAGAINIPLKRLDRESTGSFEKSRPIVVY